MSLHTTLQGKLLRSIILSAGNTRNAVNSYNWFIEERIPAILKESAFLIENGYYLTFSNPEFVRPMMTRTLEKGNTIRTQMLPMTARREKLSYMAEMICQVNILKDEGNSLKTVDSAKVLLGEIPVLTGSFLDHVGIGVATPEERILLGESELQIPGQFIIQSEKVFMNIEKLRTHIPLIYKDKKDWVMRYTAQTLTESSIVIIKEVSESSSKGKIKNMEIHTTYTHIGITSKSVNIFFIFFMLGMGRGRSYIESLSGIQSEREMPSAVEETLDLMYQFIIDSDPERQRKRRFDLYTYLQSTINSFLTLSSNEDPWAINSHLLNIYSRDEELKLIDAAARPLKLAQYVKEDLFKNITKADDDISLRRYKATLLAYMVAGFIDFKNGYRPPDNRDWWSNKKIADVGSHLETLFILIWKEVMSNLKLSIKSGQKDIQSIVKHINPNLMTSKFISYIKKGSWGSLKGGKESVIVDSNKTDNLLMSIAIVMRISAKINPKAQIIEKRQVNNTGWGVICPTMTPDGTMCGIVKEMAQTAHISLARDDSLIKSKVAEFIISIDEEMRAYKRSLKKTLSSREKAEEKKYQSKKEREYHHPFILNGAVIGFCNSRELHAHLISLRRSKSIYFDTGIILGEDESLSVFTTPGRLCRPLLILDENEELVIDKKNLRSAQREKLLIEGAMEYVDVAEQIQKNFLIAVNEEVLKLKKESEATGEYNEPKYTHCEIDPQAILGVSASLIPFGEHMPGPRSSYQCGMNKQAPGPNVRRHDRRFDKTMKVHLFPGVPFIATDAHETLGMDKYPSGTQVIVAFMCYDGSNQEDATNLNNFSLERGLFNMMIYHSYNATFITTGNYKEEPYIPEEKRHDEAYRNLDPNTGIVRKGAYVKSDDVIIAKYFIEFQPDEKTGQVKMKNASVKVDIGTEGFVDDVLDTPMEGGQGRLVQVRIREYRVPQTGDKFAFRYSQKGVMGQNIKGSDMPWIFSDNPLLNGVVPDVLFNPHGLPSRMTVGMLIEVLEGRVSVITGERFNATVFRDTVKKVYKEGETEGLKYVLKTLKEHGFDESGKVKMVNGRTGRIIDSEIFIGPAYYQLLKHLVKDKMQARGTGPVQILTRQPVSGIRKVGGLKLGEMERDTFISHGASYVLQERMILSSDAYQAIICTKCHTLAYSSLDRTSFICYNCAESKSFIRTIVPHAMILLNKYLAGSGISIKYFTSPSST